VKAHTNGPVAKAFNANFATLFDQVAQQPRRPGCLYASEDEAREVTEQLIRDAGYEPISLGGIENVRALEEFVLGVFMKIGQTFYRFAPPGEL
jgi:predicted dinucleotide-binding enzyme